MLVAGGLLAACIPESSGPDARCECAVDSVGRLDLRNPRQSRHLSNDAEKAEDLAIRYADGHSRPGLLVDIRWANIFKHYTSAWPFFNAAIAEQHKVTPDQVRSVSLTGHSWTTVYSGSGATIH